jgi:hypothetical protein
MTKSHKRWVRYLLMIAGGGTLFQAGSNAGYARCAGDSTLTSINFCFVFDCQNGALGGTIEFCGDQPEDDIFSDCPTGEP